MNKEIAPVLEKISAILKEADMAGLVMVANKTHCDYLMEIEPSWSCAWLEKDAKGRVAFRIRSKRVDYPSDEAQKAHLETTIGTFVTFKDVLGHLQRTVSGILEVAAQHIDFVGKSTFED